MVIYYKNDSKLTKFVNHPTDAIILELQLLLSSRLGDCTRGAAPTGSVITVATIIFGGMKI